MPVNAKTAEIAAHHKVLAVGEAGCGKTVQIATLPGRKFVYAFDPGTLPTLVTRKVDADVEEFLPDIATVDFSLKGFNKGARSDASSRRKPLEPAAYTSWEAHFNSWYDSGQLAAYDWICFDSLTLFVKAIMNRLLYLNNRYGDVEDLSDYRVVGNKLTSVFTAIASMKANLYVTGHLTTFQDETTKRITTQLGIPGASRDMLPKLFSNIWLLQAAAEDKPGYTMLTRAEARGFQALRTLIPDLPPRIDVTVKDWSRPENYGIGAVLKGAKLPVAALKSAIRLVAKPENGKPAEAAKTIPQEGAAEPVDQPSA